VISRGAVRAGDGRRTETEKPFETSA
jgi:hypothetical protein